MNESRISQLIDINNERDMLNELYDLVDEFYNDTKIDNDSASSFIKWLKGEALNDLSKEV